MSVLNPSAESRKLGLSNPLMITVQDDNLLQVKPGVKPIRGINCCLWQHNWDAQQLVTWAKAHAPQIVLDEYLQYRPKRLVERLSVRLMLHQMAPEAPTLEHLPSGAPYLPDQEVHISISHTQGAYCLSLGETRHGIDLEKWGDKALRVRNMFIRDDEQPLFEAMASTLIPEQIATLIWSAKESIYKLFDIPGLSLRDDIQLTYQSSDTLSATLPRLHATAHLHFRLYPHFVFTCAFRTEDLVER